MASDEGHRRPPSASASRTPWRRPRRCRTRVSARFLHFWRSRGQTLNAAGVCRTPLDSLPLDPETHKRAHHAMKDRRRLIARCHDQADEQRVKSRLVSGIDKADAAARPGGLAYNDATLRLLVGQHSGCTCNRINWAGYGRRWKM